MKRFYISGKITGLPKKEYEQTFKMAENYLLSKGSEVVNPIRISPYKNRPTWRNYMIRDIQELVTCSHIYMLKGWWRSKGARSEWVIAKLLGIKIIYQGGKRGK